MVVIGTSYGLVFDHGGGPAVSSHDDSSQNIYIGAPTIADCGYKWKSLNTKLESS